MAYLVEEIEGIVKPKKNRKPMKAHTKVTSYGPNGRIFHNQRKEKKKQAKKKDVPFVGAVTDRSSMYYT